MKEKIAKIKRQAKIIIEIETIENILNNRLGLGYTPLDENEFITKSYPTKYEVESLNSIISCIEMAQDKLGLSKEDYIYLCKRLQDNLIDALLELLRRKLSLLDK